MKTEILLLFFCLLNPKADAPANSPSKPAEAKGVVAVAKMDMFSPLFLIEL